LLTKGKGTVSQQRPKFEEYDDPVAKKEGPGGQINSVDSIPLGESKKKKIQQPIAFV